MKVQDNRKNQMEIKSIFAPGRKDRGFSLVEMVIVVAIFSILLGITIPSMNSVLGFRVQRAVGSITSALDKTKTEAMNRLVAEMKLEKKQDGYYISYCLDRGKTSQRKEEQPEKIAPARTVVSYTTSDGTDHEMKAGDFIILTYDRATGKFLPLQDVFLTQEDILLELEAGKDIPLKRTGNYCTSITVSGGYRTRIIRLSPETGQYTVEAGTGS